MHNQLFNNHNSFFFFATNSSSLLPEKKDNLIRNKYSSTIQIPFTQNPQTDIKVHIYIQHKSINKRENGEIQIERVTHTNEASPRLIKIVDGTNGGSLFRNT